MERKRRKERDSVKETEEKRQKERHRVNETEEMRTIEIKDIIKGWNQMEETWRLDRGRDTERQRNLGETKGKYRRRHNAWKKQRGRQRGRKRGRGTDKRDGGEDTERVRPREKIRWDTGEREGYESDGRDIEGV
jgi:hypothetical protein